MNSRRKFLILGSMATTAALAAKPFKTFANASSRITGFNTNDNKLILLHTGDFSKANHQQVFKHMADIKNNTGNVVLLNAGNEVAGNVASFKYDASISHNNSIATSANNYRIIYKGNIKIGVISAASGERNVVNNINELSSWLKNEKNCHVVVCLSQLGYKNKRSVDDQTLAAQSTSLDIIIGGNAKNYIKHPAIHLNKNKAEVVINHATENDLAFGKIEIAFDDHGQKRDINFDHKARVKLTA